MALVVDEPVSGLAVAGGDARPDAVTEALQRARARIAAEADDREASLRRKARRALIGKILVGGMFVIMLFERAVNGGWL